MASKSKVTKKRSAASPAKKRKRKKAKRQPVPRVDPSSPAVQLRVWDAYCRTRSLKATARDTEYAIETVRKVVYSDMDRVKRMIQDRMEDIVARYELEHDRAQTIMDDLLGLVERWIAEIIAATSEGRETRIMGKNGPMMPIEATEWLVMSKALDQLLKLRATALNVSAQFRGGIVPNTGDGKPYVSGDQPVIVDMEAMDETSIVKLIRRGGFDVPPALEAKVKLIESTLGEG